MLIPFNDFALVIGEDLYQRKGSIAKSLEFRHVGTLCLPCPALLAWPPGIGQYGVTLSSSCPPVQSSPLLTCSSVNLL